MHDHPEEFSRMTLATLKRFLVCDDDNDFRRRLVRSLRDRGYEVYEAFGAQEGLQNAIEFDVQAVIVDLRMPGESGLWLVKELAEKMPTCKTVVLTGFGSINTALEAVRLGAINYLTKPAPVEKILLSFSPDSRAENLEATAPSLAEVESEYVHRVLAEQEGNVSSAAKILGVHRRSLQRKLRK